MKTSSVDGKRCLVLQEIGRPDLLAHTVGVCVFATNFCDRECRHCLNRLRPKQEISFIDESLVAKLVDEVTATYRVPAQVHVIGDGEPLFHPRLQSLAAIALEAGAEKFFFMTSGPKPGRKKEMRRFLLTLGVDHHRVVPSLSFNLFLPQFMMRLYDALKLLINHSETENCVINLSYGPRINQALMTALVLLRIINRVSNGRYTIFPSIILADATDGYNRKADDIFSSNRADAKYSRYLRGSLDGFKFMLPREGRRPLTIEIQTEHVLFPPLSRQPLCPALCDIDNPVPVIASDGNVLPHFLCPNIPAVRLGHVSEIGLSMFELSINQKMQCLRQALANHKYLGGCSRL